MATNKYPSEIKLYGATVGFDESTLKAPDGKRRFDMVAYSGAPVEFAFGRMVVDMAGMHVASQKNPILRDHDTSQVVGFSEEVIVDGSIRIKGQVTSVTSAGREVAQLSDDGFPWQASIHFSILGIEEVPAGRTVKVNGADFAGPGVVVRKSKFKESSFTPLGRDSNTRAVVLEDRMSDQELEAKFAAMLDAKLGALVEAKLSILDQKVAAAIALREQFPAGEKGDKQFRAYLSNRKMITVCRGSSST
jgi:hypothetical protein